MRHGIVLIRHPEVALRWRGRCYGRSDPGLSRSGHRRALEIAHRLSRWRAEVVIWSGVRRTGVIAQAVAGARLIVDARWAERDFGAWEERTWRSIYRETGNAMDGMIIDPERFRPGGGETTSELIERVLAAWNDRPRVNRLAVISHGGPIAAVRAAIGMMPVTDLPRYMPKFGEVVAISCGKSSR